MPRTWTSLVLREVLPNGLTLLVQRDDSAPAVAVVTHVKAGFFDEPDRWVGISHVLEHMYFKGTQRRGVGAIARETKAAGGYLNASTSYDATNYFTVLPAAGLLAALDIQSDALMHSLIDPEELARELRVIIQEAKRKLDTPSSLAHETLHEVMFDRHRIRRWRIGTEAALASFTRDDLWGYYTSRYVPSRTIVAIVGAMDPEEALERARDIYGGWEARPGAVDLSPTEPDHSEIRARTLRGDVTLAQLVVGWRAVPPLDPDAPALDLAAAVLGAGRGSTLYRTLRDTGLVTSVGVHNYAPTELGVFSVSAEMDGERIPETLTRIAEAVARLALVGPEEEELERARTLYLTRWVQGLEPMEGRASALAAAEALGGIELLDKEYEALSTLSARAVQQAASRYLDPGAVAAVAYLPRGRAADVTPDSLGSAFAVSELTPALSVASPHLRPRSVPSPPLLECAGTTHAELPGCDLLIRRKQGVPAVTLGLYVPRLQLDPPGEEGLTALVARAALRGAGGLDAASLAYAFERLGGAVSHRLSLDWVGVGTTVQSGQVEQAAALLDLVFRTPGFSEHEIEAERSVLVEEALQAADDMFRYPFQLAFASGFGDHGYGVPAGGLPETLRGLTASQVRTWHRETFLSRRSVVIAVGDVEPESTAEALARVFAPHPARGDQRSFAPQAWLAREGQSVREVKREKAQSAFALVFPGPKRRDPERHAAEVWAAVASGLGGRLFDALRDRRSLAYTVMASAWLRARAGALITYIATSPEREEEAYRAMLAELERFRLEPVSEAELIQARNYLAGQAEVSRQSASEVAAELLEAWLIGEGLEEMDDPGGPYRRVTGEQVLAVASKSLDPALAARGVVRGIGGGR